MKNINKLIGFTIHQMNENDRNLFMFNDFDNSKIEFEVFDLSPLKNKYKKQNSFINKIKTSTELENIIQKNYYFIIYFNPNNLPILGEILKKYNDKVCIRLFNDIVPFKPLSLKYKINLLFFNFKRIFDYPKLILYFFKKILSPKYKFKTINFYSGTRNSCFEVPHFEYEKVKNFERNKSTSSSNYHVFIDQNWPYHRDNDTYDCFYNTDNYFKELNKFFEFIENNTGKPFKVALHPRTLNQSGDYGNRELIKNKTVELVANSDIVFAHSSTAINIALLFDKDLILLKNKEITPIKYRNINSWASELNIKLLDFGNEFDVLNFRQFINKKNYARFIKKFIISDKLIANYRSASAIIVNFISMNSEKFL